MDKMSLDQQKAAIEKMLGEAVTGNGAADGSGWEGGKGASFGERFVKSDAYAMLKARDMSSDVAWSTPEVKVGPMLAKTVLTEASGGTALVQPDVQPGVLPLLFKRLTIADLIPQAETISVTVRYLQETTFTNAAATAAEGALIPESAEVFAQVDEPVRKIAHYIPTTEEMLSDAPAIRDFINARLVLGLRLTEETQLLSGSGTPPDLIGILNRSGLATAQPRGTDSNIDAILKQKTAIAIATNSVPDAVVINPSNWQTIQLSKDAQGQYYEGGGPFAAANGGFPSLWGMRVVVTPSISAGSALVGGFAQNAQMFRNGGIELVASNSHSDYFQRMQVALRASERLALAVYRPACFGTVTSLN